jgi:flavin reductase (DIM6/NTAB) family NADH-FMN oxidoreductase RutF
MFYNGRPGTHLSLDRFTKGHTLNMALDKDFFRTVMGQFATGVTVATARSSAGVAGLTVNSFTSVSLDPLLVLICVELHSQAIPFFREGGVFAVNILNQEQEAVSNCFATSSEERYNYFCHVGYKQAATGSPILDGCLAFLDVRITAEYPGGDHAIFLGRVEAMGHGSHVFFMPGVSSAQCTLPMHPAATNHASSNGHSEAAGAPAPLLFYRGQYHHLAPRYHHAHPDLEPAQAQHESNN